MATSAGGSGGDFLQRKSDLNKARTGAPRIADVLVVDDVAADITRLAARLRIVLGYTVDIRTAQTLSRAVDEVIAKVPDLVMLDDHLDASRDRACEGIPFLRRTGYAGPIVVVSGLVTRKRRAELMAIGADGVIHKDDLNSASITEALDGFASRSSRQSP
ncbi:MAG: response regulator [Hyphomicrobiaceae bacterium]|nr:response regulator [Hyphomicrobiaceae bacterium]